MLTKILFVTGAISLSLLLAGFILLTSGSTTNDPRRVTYGVYSFWGFVAGVVITLVVAMLDLIVQISSGR